MINDYYILLTGAIKNVGDFLIADRSKKLISLFVSKKFFEFNRWEVLDDKLDLINASKAIIICGGPGYAEDMYPKIYPLVKDLRKLKVPVIPLGVGWSGKPINNPLEFKFTPCSRKLMDYIHYTDLYSCRDDLTKDILFKEGYNKVLMTGCPVWYDIDFINRSMQIKKDINKIVFTTPANPKLFFETIKIMDFIRKKFSGSEIFVTFHRGIKRDKYTSWKSAIIYNLIAKYAKNKGFKVKDVSYNLSKIDFYQTCDLHIGYRVHAHLYFLSKRLPSILICEDGRGLGMVKTMKLPIFKSGDSELISKLDVYLQQCFYDSFGNLSYVSDIIDKQFEVMKEFLLRIKSL